MFKKLGQKLKELAGDSDNPAMDLSSLNDPLAEMTEWTPLKRGGSSMCTHRLRIDNPDRVRFNMTVILRVFLGIFVVVGLSVLTGGLVNGLPNPDSVADILFPVVFGLIFAGVGGAMLYVMGAPTVFDRTSGYYWKGRVDPELLMPGAELENGCALDEIHALQIISEYCRSDKSHYWSYELNLVLHDGRRLNVTDHGSATKLREDADQLAEFLGVPVWDMARN